MIAAKNNSLCTFWQTALGSLSERVVTFPRGVNRVVIGTGTAGPVAIAWRPDGGPTNTPADGGSPVGSAQLIGGVRVIGAGWPAVTIEVETASSTWAFRNLSGAATSLFIEGHIVSGAG